MFNFKDDKFNYFFTLVDDILVLDNCIVFYFQFLWANFYFQFSSDFFRAMLC